MDPRKIWISYNFQPASLPKWPTVTASLAPTKIDHRAIVCLLPTDYKVNIYPAPLWQPRFHESRAFDHIHSFLLVYLYIFGGKTIIRICRIPGRTVESIPSSILTARPCIHCTHSHVYCIMYRSLLVLCSKSVRSDLPRLLFPDRPTDDWKWSKYQRSYHRLSTSVL